jgi:hypothetical protein
MLSDRVGLSRDMREKTDRYREREIKRNSDSGVTIVKTVKATSSFLGSPIRQSHPQRGLKYTEETHLLSICSISSSLL